MIKTIIGLILLLIPFLLVYRFNDKRKGFFYILSFLIAFHLIIGIITQLFGIFNYAVVVGINLFIVMILLKKVNFNTLKENFKKIKIDWIFLLVVLILFIQLYSVHFNYTGEVTTVTQPYKKVESMKYSYPYFSDEWVAVSLIDYSVSSGNLPLVNPLWHNHAFPNLELPFHSFVSEIMILLNLNPLTQYSVLHIFSGIIICGLIYFILRVNSIGKLISGVTALSVPYVINGANLPGIWTLIPLIMGIISLLLGFLFMSINDKKMAVFLGFLTLLFYPPLFLLYTFGFLFYLLFNKISIKEKFKYMGIYFGICVLVVLLLSLFVYFIEGNFFSFIFSRIFYGTFTKGAIPDFSIWKVIPISILIIAFFGFLKLFKNKKFWLIVPIIIGLICWWLYSFVLWRFIIEYERIVVATSFLIVLMSGFSLNYLKKYLKEFNEIKKYKIVEIILVIVLILFFVFSFSYTQRDDWKELKLHSMIDDGVYNPASPSNNYLHEDDLELFRDINNKRFLTMPWKGLVIGVATNNYPLLTKFATLTNVKADFNEFMNLNCEKKKIIVKEKEIDYVYSEKFECKGFELIGKSEEGFYLYKVNFS